MKRITTMLALFCAVSFATHDEEYEEEEQVIYFTDSIGGALLQNKQYTGKVVGCVCGGDCSTEPIDPAEPGYDCTSIVTGNMKNGELDGEYKKAYGWGNLLGTYKNGKEQGEWKMFYENGNLQSVMNYKDGKRHGEHKMFYDNGKPQSVMNYKDGMPQGEHKSLYESGKLQSVMNYKDGVPQGEYKMFYDNGKPQSVITYKDGMPHEIKTFDKDGNLQSTKSFKQGVRR